MIYTLAIPIKSFDFETIDNWLHSADITKFGYIVKDIDANKYSDYFVLASVYVVYGFSDEMDALKFRLAFDAKVVLMDKPDLEFLKCAIINNEQTQCSED